MIEGELGYKGYSVINLIVGGRKRIREGVGVKEELTLEEEGVREDVCLGMEEKVIWYYIYEYLYLINKKKKIMKLRILIFKMYRYKFNS